MKPYKHLFYLLIAFTFYTSKASAAFVIKPAATITTTSVDSPVYKGEKLYSPGEPGNEQPYKKQVNRQFSKPYKNREREAKLALILGILGLYPFMGITSIPALVLGIIAADRRNKYYNKAVAGIVLGAIPIAIGIIVLVVALLLI